MHVRVLVCVCAVMLFFEVKSCGGGGGGGWVCLTTISCQNFDIFKDILYKLEFASVRALSVMQSLCRVTDMKLASAILLHMTAYLKLSFVICVEKNLSFLFVYQPHT